MIKSNSPRSLAGAAIARRLMEQISVGKVRRADTDLCGIRATCRVTEAGTLVLDLDARQTFKHGTYRDMVRRHYIRSNGVSSSINRAVTALLNLKRGRAGLFAAREALFLLVETKDFGALERMVGENPGRCDDYVGMTQADIDFWTPLVSALPNAQAAA